jgi:hypothetical protein
MNKEKPILFSTPMVRAILEGRKTMTRRVIKLKYSNTHFEMRTDKYGTRLVEKQNEEPGITIRRNADGTTTRTLLAVMDVNPKYKPGDMLWVRETWGDYAHDDPESHAAFFMYRADYPQGAKTYEWPEPDEFGDKIICDLPRWHPSMFMPREAARIFLRVTDVRPERLQDINNEDCYAEGAMEKGLCPPMRMLIRNTEGSIPRTNFRILWDSLNVKRGYGWATNPWVWVYTFERIERGANDGTNH